MKLNNNDLYAFFLDKGITHLHHANTVATSITFLEKGGLLSRGQILSRGLFQTKQDSDDDDKQYDVWDDIFFDTKDLHGHFPRQNLYGPVLFKYNSNVILNNDLDILVTKNNPMFWNPDTLYENKYFMDMEDIQSNWDKYQLQRKMVTLRKPKNILPFEKLENIIIDNPNVIIYGDTDLYKEISNSIESQVNGMFALTHRTCHNCFCQKNYLNQYSASKLAKSFLPVDHPRFFNDK